MAEGLVLAYENEEEMEIVYDELRKIKKDYFEILVYFEPYPWIDLRYFIVLKIHPGFMDELNDLLIKSGINLGNVVIQNLRDVESDIEKMEQFEFLEERRPIIIGKDIPIISGRKEFINWEIHTGIGRVASFKDFKDAIEEYPYIFDGYLKRIKNAIRLGKVETSGYWTTGNNIPMICPLYKYEYAVMNPYVVGWNECVLPLIWIKTEKECSNYEGEMIDGVCIIPFGEADQHEWNENKFRIKELRNIVFELAKKWDVPIEIKENIIEIPKIWRNAKLIKWKVIKIFGSYDEKIYPTEYDTFDDVSNNYNQYFVNYIENIKKAKVKSEKEKNDYWLAHAIRTNLPVIYPFYFDEKKNRTFYVEDFGLLPLLFVETEKECQKYEGNIYKGICIRKFTGNDMWDWYYAAESLWIKKEYKGKFKNLIDTILELTELYNTI